MTNAAEMTAPEATETTEPRHIGTATYSPDDNKLRLYPFSRLSPELYARVKAAGFKWAPRQELFVAPMWTPGREDLLIELCGEVSDDDSSLVDRAEERAERFEDYSERRAADAQQAKAGVDRIAEHIPLGRPILVGHHSERRARKDAERIRNGMRKAVKLWETAQYWEQRAAGAIRHARYKERPDVRHRRIKGIESDLRKEQKNLETATQAKILWSDPALTHKQAWDLANSSGYGFQIKRPDAKTYSDYDSVWSLLDANKITVAEAQERAERVFSGIIKRAARWITHYNNRLAYERAMLADALGAAPGTDNAMAERFDIKPGGRILARRETEWLVVMRVNRKDGAIQSVTTTAPRVVTWSKTWRYGIEEVTDYRPPSEEDAAKVKKATTLPPLCNYPGDGFREMTAAEWKKSCRYSDSYFVYTLGATETAGRHRVRTAPTPGAFGKRHQVFITDAKRVDPPKPGTAAEPVTFAREMNDPEAPRPQHKAPEPTAFDAMRDQLKHGVKVVTAPQLFPTPAAVVEKIISYARIAPGDRVLEPSAGTGAILRALPNVRPDGTVTAVEINSQLAAALEGLADKVVCSDFLECRDLGAFDCIVMNPPFKDGADIKHILHARTMLASGGRLVAVCAAGPRQIEQLQPLADHWEDLPAGSFREQGTDVQTALIVLGAP